MGGEEHGILTQHTLEEAGLHTLLQTPCLALAHCSQHAAARTTSHHRQPAMHGPHSPDHKVHRKLPLLIGHTVGGWRHMGKVMCISKLVRFFHALRS